ncbi:MAG: DNA-binding response regulator [Owenweeksia sp.]|nr:DNA-binding response regulator [Owenweeksia sp.]MBG00046.1 DNA-binding response regulator [Owenweeksia sp.]HBF21286.1 DNA-binding response regulator [Cryomorphaceae bacterium]|tara:strand:- start:1887 stop:2633 length:747 start_codon:yes stop_codon:yes gene_type:complete
MIETILIDDEAPSRSILRDMLRRYCPDIKIIGESANLADGVELIRKHQPQLAFLDINMPNGSGFDLLKAFPEAGFQVVFVTAHDEYAIRAIRVSAMDFLLKPVNIKELQDCVERIKVKLSRETEKNNLRMLVENMQSKQDLQSRIAIPLTEGLQFVVLGDIIRLEADGNYTWIWLTKGKKMLSSHNLKEYQDLLSDTFFFRAHHSHLINLQHVDKYHRGEGGSISMCDGSEVPLAKRRKKPFLELFKL